MVGFLGSQNSGRPEGPWEPVVGGTLVKVVFKGFPGVVRGRHSGQDVVISPVWGPNATIPMEAGVSKQPLEAAHWRQAGMVMSMEGSF